MGYRIRKMKSWDCFDTVVARRYHSSTSIFDEVGKILSIPNFTKMRIDAELDSDGTIDSIYKNLKGISKETEISVDIEHCYPIVSNINKVQDGDIIISDIFYSADVVERILKKCGLNKKVKIVVSPDGKRKGWIWKTLPQTIELHTGDNYKSDVKSASKNGIKSFHYVNSFFNEIEETISKNNFQLACLMKYVRLSCPYTNEDEINYWEDQSNFNIPVLALASLELPNTTIAFTQRDSVYWKPIYESITNRLSVDLDASRLCYYSPSKEYTDYAINQTKNCVVADLQGSGKSFFSFFKETKEIYYIGGPIINKPNIKSISGISANAIEKHNCSSKGTLVGWNNGPIRKVSEHNHKLVEIQSKAISTALQMIQNFKITKNINDLKFLLTKMNNNFTHRTVEWVENHNV
jgi:hypothetical protein